MFEAFKKENLKTNQPIETNYKEIIKILQANIEYNILRSNNPTSSRLIDEIIFIMTDTILSESKYKIINKEKKNIDLVKSVLMKLKYHHIEYVLEQFKNVTYEIKNKKAYILTSLYNSFSEIDLHYVNSYNSNKFTL